MTDVWGIRVRNEAEEVMAFAIGSTCSGKIGYTGGGIGNDCPPFNEV